MVTTYLSHICSAFVCLTRGHHVGQQRAASESGLGVRM